jgi:hypothetical protein
LKEIRSCFIIITATGLYLHVSESCLSNLQSPVKPLHIERCSHNKRCGIWMFSVRTSMSCLRNLNSAKHSSSFMSWRLKLGYNSYRKSGFFELCEQYKNYYNCSSSMIPRSWHMRNNFCNSLKDDICMNKLIFLLLSKILNVLVLQCCLNFVFPAENGVFVPVLFPPLRLGEYGLNFTFATSCYCIGS